MDLRLQIFASGAALLLLVVVFELVRRKALLERYALLWLFSALVLLLLAVWRQLLSGVADAIGIYYPPSALFAVAFAFVLLLLLHFSLAVSRLTDQSKVLAQRQALLEERLREREHAEGLARVAPARHGNGEHQPNGERGGNGERRVRSSSRHTSDQ
jgi:hypothetical protein